MGALGDDVKSGWWLPSSSWATANSVCLAQCFQEAPDESPGVFLRLSCRKPRGPAPFKRLRSPGSPRPAFQHCNSVADGHRLSASPQAPLFLWPPQLSFLSPLGPFLSLALFTHSRRLPWKSHGPSSVRETERKRSSGGRELSRLSQPHQHAPPSVHLCSPDLPGEQDKIQGLSQFRCP